MWGGFLYSCKRRLVSLFRQNTRTNRPVSRSTKERFSSFAMYKAFRYVKYGGALDTRTAKLTVCTRPRTCCGVLAAPVSACSLFEIFKKLCPTPVYFQDKRGKASCGRVFRARSPPLSSNTLPNRPVVLLLLTKIHANPVNQTGSWHREAITLRSSARHSPVFFWRKGVWYFVCIAYDALAPRTGSRPRVARTADTHLVESSNGISATLALWIGK